MNYFRLRKLRRQVAERRASARHLLHADDDILSDSEKSLLEETVSSAGNAVKSGPDAMESFIKDSDRRMSAAFPLRRGWTAYVRDFLDLLAVAGAAAFGVRALYLQPFKIPTGSMQPTLFGIHYIDRQDAAPNLPSPVNRITGSMATSFAAVKSPGELDEYSMQTISGSLLGFPRTYFKVGSDTYSLPGDKGRSNQVIIRPPSDGSGIYRPGDTLSDGWLSSGDHLFVDRVTLHFREPRRGDVTVFNTEEIERRGSRMNGYYYIKRLAGLPGDTIKIVDGKLFIKPEREKEFNPSTDFSPNFEKIYSGLGGYHGHVASGLLSEGVALKLPKDCYFMLGDNTTGSYDSRAWGFVPRRSIVGIARFVFWPVTRRWGFADSKPPIQRPTKLPLSMWIQ